MAGVKYSGRCIPLSNEAADQHAIVEEAIKKLADLSKRSWDLIDHECYNREIRFAAIYGAFIGAGMTIGMGICAKKMLKKDTESKKE